jgi:competence protein CoiA
LEHHLLKSVLASAIRSAGWHAELEVPAPDGSWRADVLASSPDGSQRMAWEAQLSPIKEEDIRMRTQRYADAGISVCWVSPAGSRALWFGVVPAIRVTSVDRAAWSVADGLFRFVFEDGTWLREKHFPLTTTIGWILQGSLISHTVLPRYRRVQVSGNGWQRRTAIWTSPRNIPVEARHEIKRKRQDEWKQRRIEEETRAGEARRIQAASEKAERERQAALRKEERERQAAINAEAQRVHWEEQRRKLAQEAAQREERLAAEQSRRDEAVNQERARRAQEEHREQLSAQRWLAEVSTDQFEELVHAVTSRPWKRFGTRPILDSQGSSRDYAYGTAMFMNHRLYGVLRPCPDTLHLLPPHVRVFVRNAREADLIHQNLTIDDDLVIHFDFPDHNQLSLLG